eukprot:gnl/MRDRNA2_/MRDRNA2_101335_c0_seq1.p1 gnl/MRDRNA2_/MRDRNA2_101335_c0~~gnl/MRDRNA2_/MRDRNA2_101335_c0_seq1.p1  ORF type:complete len:305 (+),score=79.02 gnl/MRDRNA2_/MRDRNA2_101335_c0_seq1:46-960(+)
MGDPEGSSAASAAPEADVEEEETTLSTGLQLPLKPSQIEAVWALNDHEEQGLLLGKMLTLADESGENFRNEALQDFYVYNLVHCKSIGLDARQAAAFHAIMERMLEMMQDAGVPGAKINPQDATNPNDCFKQFEVLMREHSVGPNAIFFTSQAKLLTDFASMTLFKHYLLYQYLLYHDRETEVLRFEMNYEQPLPPPDLSAARLVNAGRKSKRGLGSTAGGGYGATGGMASSKGMDGNVSPRYMPPSETPEVRDLTEEEEIEELVQAKLAEVQAKLDKKLKDREDAFQEKMASEAAAAAAPKKK